LIIIEILIFMSSVLPIYHLLNALFDSLKKKEVLPFAEKEKKFSILIPCFNEEALIAFSIKKLLEMNYSNYEVIFINDGSTDNTFEKLTNELKLKKAYLKGVNIYKSKIYKNFYVINNKNEGKSQSLNLGIKFASSDYIVTLDADSVLHEDALKHMNRAFSDENVIAAGGAIHIIQGYDKTQGKVMNKLILLQILDYIKGFYIYKLSLHKQNATAIISGAFGVFRRDALFAAGGYRKTLGEDIDITLKIQYMIKNTKKKILYLPEALCYTQCPESFRDLVRQRLRWQKGFINCFFYYKKEILKTFFYNSLSYHFFIEAFLISIASIYFSLITFIILLIFANAAAIKLYIYYLIFRIIFRGIYSVVAINISQKYHLYPKDTVNKLYKVLILDIFVFPMLLMILYIIGAFMYIWGDSGSYEWEKVARTDINYIMEEHENG